MPSGRRDAVVMREHVHWLGGAGEDDPDDVELRAAAAPYQHVRSIGEDVSAAELLLPRGAPAAAGRRGSGRGGRGHDRARGAPRAS